MLLLIVSQFARAQFHSEPFLSLKNSSKSRTHAEKKSRIKKEHARNYDETPRETTNHHTKNGSDAPNRPHKTKQAAHKEVFMDLDIDRDGFISMVELLVSDDDIEPEDAGAFIEELDYDLDFLISWEENESALHAQEFGRTQL